MSDVGKASDMIIEKIDEQRVALGQTPLKEGNLEGLTEDLGEDTQQSSKISNEEALQEEVSGETVTSSERQDDDISNILDNKPLIEKVFYGEFNLPEWSIPYLKDGNEYGLTAEQLKTVKISRKIFLLSYQLKLQRVQLKGIIIQSLVLQLLLIRQKFIILSNILAIFSLRTSLLVIDLTRICPKTIRIARLFQIFKHNTAILTPSIQQL